MFKLAVILDGVYIPQGKHGPASKCHKEKHGRASAINDIKELRSNI